MASGLVSAAHSIFASSASRYFRGVVLGNGDGDRLLDFVAVKSGARMVRMPLGK